MAGRGNARGSGSGRRHHQYELGPCPHRNGRYQSADLRGGERRRAGVQQVARANGGATRARQYSRARLDRDRLRCGVGRRAASGRRRVGAAEALGDAQGRRGRRSLSRVAGCIVPHGTDPARWWRRGHVTR